MNPQEPQHTPPKEPEVSDEDKLLAILAYVPVLCLLPFTQKDRSEFVSGHVRLGMALFVIEIFTLILRLRFVWDMLLFLCIAGAVIGILHVVQGRNFFIPFLSDFFSRKP